MAKRSVVSGTLSTDGVRWGVCRSHIPSHTYSCLTGNLLVSKYRYWQLIPFLWLPTISQWPDGMSWWEFKVRFRTLLQWNNDLVVFFSVFLFFLIFYRNVLRWNTIQPHTSSGIPFFLLYFQLPMKTLFTRKVLKHLSPPFRLIRGLAN